MPEKTNPVPEGSEPLEILETNQTVYSTRGLNRTDFYLILFDVRWVQETHMAQLAQNMKLCGIHFSLIPVQGDPSNAIHISQTNPAQANPKEVYIPASKEPKEGG